MTKKLQKRVASRTMVVVILLGVVAPWLILALLWLIALR